MWQSGKIVLLQISVCFAFVFQQSNAAMEDSFLKKSKIKGLECLFNMPNNGMAGVVFGVTATLSGIGLFCLMNKLKQKKLEKQKSRFMSDINAIDKELADENNQANSIVLRDLRELLRNEVGLMAPKDQGIPDINSLIVGYVDIAKDYPELQIEQQRLLNQKLLLGSRLDRCDKETKFVASELEGISPQWTASICCYSLKFVIPGCLVLGALSGVKPAQQLDIKKHIILPGFLIGGVCGTAFYYLSSMFFNTYGDMLDAI